MPVRVASTKHATAAGPSKDGHFYGDVLEPALDDATLAGPPTSRAAATPPGSRSIPHSLLLLLPLLLLPNLATGAFSCDGNYKTPFQCSGGNALRKSVTGVTGKTQATCTTYCEGQSSSSSSGCCYFKPNGGTCKFFPDQINNSPTNNGRHASMCTQVTNCVSGSTYNTGTGQTPCDNCQSCPHGDKAACTRTSNTVCNAAPCSPGSTWDNGAGTGRYPC